MAWGACQALAMDDQSLLFNFSQDCLAALRHRWSVWYKLDLPLPGICIALLSLLRIFRSAPVDSLQALIAFIQGVSAALHLSYHLAYLLNSSSIPPFDTFNISDSSRLL